MRMLARSKLHMCHDFNFMAVVLTCNQIAARDIIAAHWAQNKACVQAVRLLGGRLIDRRVTVVCAEY